MICGWWLSPEVYLIRPVHGKDPDRWRLDKLLKRKAESGVKIYILVFNAPSLIANNPQHTQSALVSQHPNIQV
jgi:phospholipase D1/2